MQCMMQMQVDWLLAAVDCSLQSATTPAPQPPAQLVALVACFYLLSFFVGLVACILLVVLLFDLLPRSAKTPVTRPRPRPRRKKTRPHKPTSQGPGGRGRVLFAISWPFLEHPSLPPRPPSLVVLLFFFLLFAGCRPVPLALALAPGWRQQDTKPGARQVTVEVDKAPGLGGPANMEQR
jgi:hypothetical protein